MPFTLCLPSQPYLGKGLLSLWNLRTLIYIGYNDTLSYFVCSTQASEPEIILAENENEDEGEHEQPAILAPQVRIDADGNVVLDEQRYWRENGFSRKMGLKWTLIWYLITLVVSKWHT